MTPKVKFSDIFLLVLCGIFAQVIALALAASLHAAPFWTAIAGAIANAVCWIAGYQWLFKSRGWDSLQGRFSPVAGRVLLASAAGAVVLILLVVAITQIMQWSGIKIVDLPRDALLTSNLSQLPVLLSFIVIIGPMAEELMFRGLLLDWLRQKMAAWPAILIISLLFAFMHNNHLRTTGAAGWLALTYKFSVGIGTSYLALRYRSLRPSFVLHATNNCVAAMAIAVPLFKASL